MSSRLPSLLVFPLFLTSLAPGSLFFRGGWEYMRNLPYLEAVHNCDQRTFSNIERAKRIAQDTVLDKALERIPRKIIDDALDVECTREWGDGWEVLEPYLNNNDFEDSYHEMMEWIAGGGLATGQVIRNSRRVKPAYERLTQLLNRLQSAKDSGELDAANREEKQQLVDQYGISPKQYDPADIWFDDP